MYWFSRYGSHNFRCKLRQICVYLCFDKFFANSNNIPQNERCGECLTKLKNCLTYNESPKLLILEYPYTATKTSHKIKIKVNDTTTLLYLKGIVYYGESHFTSRIISKDGKVEAKVLRKAIFLQ